MTRHEHTRSSNTSCIAKVSNAREAGAVGRPVVRLLINFNSQGLLIKLIVIVFMLMTT